MKDKYKPRWPILGPGDPIGEGDSKIIYDCLDDATVQNAQDLFNDLNLEVRWQTMSHRAGEVPRLVCAQGTFLDDGSLPVYRHPADEVPKLLSWSTTVDAIRRRVEILAGHEMNHCLIQLYRSGHDFISEHSDKTLDVVHGSSIVNVSIGAQRTMRLRTKRSTTNGDLEQRRTQLIPMPHASVFILGLHTNAVWLHGINPDKRPGAERSEAEQDFDGQRISLTFRQIGTFLSADHARIWGQGATGKDRSEARDVRNGIGEESEKLIIAFGVENHSAVLDWSGVYGNGFDVFNHEVKRT